MDFPDDAGSRAVDDEYLMGDGLLVAPIIVDGHTNGETGRSVYLPTGDWHDFWTGRRYHGRQNIQVRVPLERIPLFVKSGAVLPLAQPTLHTDDPQSWKITALVFGDGHRAATLYEDDGSSTPSLRPVTISWDAAKKTGAVSRPAGPGACAYEVAAWKTMDTPQDK